MVSIERSNFITESSNEIFGNRHAGLSAEVRKGVLALEVQKICELLQDFRNDPSITAVLSLNNAADNSLELECIMQEGDQEHKISGTLDINLDVLTEAELKQELYPTEIEFAKSHKHKVEDDLLFSDEYVYLVPRTSLDLDIESLELKNTRVAANPNSDFLHLLSIALSDRRIERLQRNDVVDLFKAQDFGLE